MNIRLSICIATFNRGRFIGETLDSIAGQLPETVEIVVLDGGSTDQTEPVVRQRQEVIPRLRYTRQDSNRGVDCDFDTVVQQAQGEYCWLMSDDDLLMPGAVESVLRALQRKVSLVIVNSEVRNFDFSKLLDPDRLRFGSDRTYSPAQFDRLFEETSAYLSYIGAVVIRRELWLARDRASYYGSYFIHVGVIFQARLPDDAVVLAQPLISIRFGNAQWRPKEFEIRMVRWTELVWSLSSVSRASIGKCYRLEPWRSLKSLVFYRAKGTYSLTEYRRWVVPRVRNRRDRIKAWMVAVLPGLIANLIGLVYCSFEYRDSNIHLLDMKVSRFYPGNLFRKA